MTARLRPLDIAAVALSLGLLALAAWVWRAGPTGLLPMHIGLDGSVDRWGHKGEIVVLLAVMAALNAAIYIGIAAYLRSGASDAGARRGAVLGQVILLVVFALVGPLLTALGFGAVPTDPAHSLGAVRLVMAGISVILLALGAVVGKAGPNPLVGVRTYWTFTSRLAWDKSNRLLGRLLFWGGLAGLLAAPFAPQPAGIVFLLAAMAAGGALVSVEAWRVWKTDPERDAPRS